MTTITTEMLKFMAHTLGLQIDTVRAFARRNGVTIDDTPADTDADTEEKTMPPKLEQFLDMDKLYANPSYCPAMTITHEQFEAACRTFMDASEEWMPSMKIALESLGITITPAEPPAEMVKLAREIAEEAWRCTRHDDVERVARAIAVCIAGNATVWRSFVPHARAAMAATLELTAEDLRELPKDGPEQLPRQFTQNEAADWLQQRANEVKDAAMDGLEQRVADEFRRHHWGSCWPQCTDNEATLAARAIIPLVLEHAAKVAEDYDGWETGDSLLTAMAIAAAIRAILQANEPTDG